MNGLGELSTKARRYAVRLWLDKRGRDAEAGELSAADATPEGGARALLLALSLWGDEPDELLAAPSFGGRAFPDDDTLDARRAD